MSKSRIRLHMSLFFFFQAEDGIRDLTVTGVQTCALPILIVILDDATSEIYYAQLVEEESPRTVMAGLREVIQAKGLFCALYSDRGSHFCTARSDLDWVFTVQTERVVAQDNTVTIGEKHWQLEKSRFRSSLAGCTVTIHEHLDETVSVRYGPHVIGRYTATGELRQAHTSQSPESRGKGGPVETVEKQKP